MSKHEQLRVIRENLNTQDNRATAIPIFAVMQKRRIYGIKRSYCDDTEIVTDDDGTRRKVRYIEVDEFVTACFTEQGCEDYIKINGHNLKAPFIFAFGGRRNAEWEFLRDSIRDGTLQIVEVPENSVRAIVRDLDSYYAPSGTQNNQPKEFTPCP